MRKTLHLVLVLLVLVIPTSLLAGDPGDSGALFLRLGMGGRAAGMGEAYSAVGKDASSVYWNPAAMSPVLGTNMMFTHNEYFQSVRLEHLAITHETDYGTFGFSFTGLYMDDMDRYEDSPSEVPLGTFGAYDVAFALAYSRYFLPNLSAGVAVKPIYQKIDNSSASGLGFDLGVYHVSRIEGVKFAAVLANLGSPMKFVEEEFALPRMFKIGGSYDRHVETLKGDILLTLDVVFPNDGNSKQHIGAEYGYSRLLFLRAGFKGGYDTQGATFGLGVRYRKFDFDYGVILGSNDLGDSHRLGLSLRN